MRRKLKNGDEWIDRGYTRVFSNGKWLLKQRVIWERVHGPIPDGYVICFLDGDCKNLAIDNLVCVPRPVGLSVTKTLGRERTPELTRAQMLVFQLQQAMKGATI